MKTKPEQPGDLNGDGEVNGTDLVSAATLILEAKYEKAVDMNNDGVVNGTDYVLLVNKILNISAAAERRASANRAATEANLSIEDFTINAGETKEMLIDLTNPDTQLTLVQFDMRLPEGLSIAIEDGELAIDIAGRTTWKKHSLNANATDGITRFLLASSTNALISGTSGAIISVKLTASSSFSGGDIKLEKQLLVTPSAEETKPADYTYTVTTTGIDTVHSSQSIVAIRWTAASCKACLRRRACTLSMAVRSW